jgi:broad specificity phosphatase PhoE
VRKTFYLVRHGVTEHPGVLLGQHDAALSDEGRRQARDVAQRMTPQGIERLVASSLRRARETAQVLSEHLGIPVEIDAGLNEISYGRWDGLSWDQIERLDPETARQKTADWWSVTPEGGEPADPFARRVERAWTLLLVHPAKATVVVAHEAVNAVLADLGRQQAGGDNKEWKPDWRRISSFRQEPGAVVPLSVPAM